MVRYTVTWSSDFESQYIDHWTRSESGIRGILTSLANWVDRELATDPELKGRPAAEASSFIVAVPNEYARISVTYQVLPDDRLVRVIRMKFEIDH